MKYQSNYLFVYGYLMQSNRQQKELEVPPMPVTFMGTAFIYGQLYLVDTFPGIIRDPKKKHRTYGEVYLLHEKKHFFEEMDRYELALPNYKTNPVYKRVILSAHLKDRIVPCWVYEYIQPITNLEKITSGRFHLNN